MGQNHKRDDQLFWHQKFRELPLESIDRVEAAARQIISLATLFQTGYFAIASLGELFHFHTSWQIILFVSPMLFLLASMWAAMRVIVPAKTDAKGRKPTRGTFITIRNQKRHWLQWSFRGLTVGMVLIIINVITFLVVSS